MKLERALDRDPFRVDRVACFHAAEVIRHYVHREEPQPWAQWSRESQLAFKLAFVSICHQFNWDFLQRRLAEVLRPHRRGIAEFLTTVTARDVSDWLKDYPEPLRIRGAERAELLRDVGRILTDQFQGRASNLLRIASRQVAGAHGFRQQLDKFLAYRSDPLRKKSNVLIHDLVREDIVEFKDPDAVEPAVDYHLIRIYLRTGRVVPTTRAVLPFLQKRPRPRERLVKLLRECVMEAVQLTAFYAKLSIPDTNYIEWQLGRSVCKTEIPRCRDLTGILLAPDIAPLVDGVCPYSSFCEALTHNEYGFLREPVFIKTFY